MVAHTSPSRGGGCFQGCMAFMNKPKTIKDMELYVTEGSDFQAPNDVFDMPPSEVVDKYDSFEALVRAMVPKNATGESDALFRSGSSTTIDPDAAQLLRLDTCFGLFNEGNASAACEYLTEDCVMHTVYGDTVEGRTDIQEWSEKESLKGAKHQTENTWVEIEQGVFKRMLNVAFPKKATHTIVQQVTVEGELIKEIVEEPKFPALRAAMRFARAREECDDEAAIKLMSEHVVWRAWNGFEKRGKEAIRALFAEERASEATRRGETEFTSANVNNTGGSFERVLYIERVDGTKVRCKRRMYVRSEVTEVDTVIVSGQDHKCYGVIPKIAEVRVLATEELVDGKWMVAEDGRA